MTLSRDNWFLQKTTNPSQGNADEKDRGSSQTEYIHFSSGNSDSTDRKGLSFKMMVKISQINDEDKVN